jgi:hypothetical protein
MTSDTEKREAPPVNPADLLAVWKLLRQARAEHSFEDKSSIAVFSGALRQACSPNADVEAVAARTLMLEILSQVKPRWPEQSNADKILEIASRFPLTLPQLGVESNAPPFDLREFMKQIASV